MGIGKEILKGIDLEVGVGKINRIKVQLAERGRQRVHLMERFLDRPAERKVQEKKQHLEERRIRKKH